MRDMKARVAEGQVNVAPRGAKHVSSRRCNLRSPKVAKNQPTPQGLTGPIVRPLQGRDVFWASFCGLHPRLLTVSRFAGLLVFLRLTHCYARTEVRNQEEPRTPNFSVAHPC